MRLWLAEAVYRESLPCSRERLEGELLPAHAAYIRAGVDRGTVLLAGPKGTGGGGFLVLRADNRAALDAFLRGFRQSGMAPVALKAVLTPSNAAWSSTPLCAELRREHDTFRHP